MKLDSTTLKPDRSSEKNKRKQEAFERRERAQQVSLKANQAQIFQQKSKQMEGKCPKFERVQNFDSQAYLGRWYQAYRDKRDIFQNGECGITDYSLMEDGKIRVESTEWRLNRFAKGKYEFGKLGKQFSSLTDKITNFGRARQIKTTNNEALFKV
mmetsp:Transcript_14720/g.25044  ORF Transcript_14720/g.25044 Transcript_14720/m.25044 type:complete len:155 (+) Transcript_14720:391-855(+)